MKKHLYKTAELFNIIDKYLAENNLKPELDYSLATSKSVAIKTYEWDVIGTVNFGGCEGIYLDVYARGNVTGDRWEDVLLGTYKTLDESKDAFKRMGDLNAEFVFAARDFVYQHMDDFEWTGFHVEFFKGETKVLGLTCPTRERAEERAKSGDYNQKYDRVVITDNATGKSEEIKFVSL